MIQRLHNLSLKLHLSTLPVGPTRFTNLINTPTTNSTYITCTTTPLLHNLSQLSFSISSISQFTNGIISYYNEALLLFCCCLRGRCGLGSRPQSLIRSGTRSWCRGLWICYEFSCYDRSFNCFVNACHLEELKTSWTN